MILPALIGKRGTGVYIESDTNKTFVCISYCTSYIQVKNSPKINETVINTYHDQSRFIYSLEKLIDTALFISNYIQELIMLERLVGRFQPFVK